MKQTRTQINTEISTYVYTNTTGLIKGDTVRDRMLNIAESFLNILTDADQPNGYVSINAIGLANTSSIKSGTPTGLFLRDDGTWNTLGATWGGITGLITNQTDLISLVNTRLALSDVDTDIALTANSDSKVASQKAIKTYVGNQLAGYQPLVSPGTTSQYWRGDKTWQTLALDTVLGIANTTGPNDIIATNNSKYRSSDGSVNLNISNSALIEFTNTDGFYTYSLDSDATSQYIQMRSYDNATTLELAYLQAFYQQVNMGVYSAATSGRLTQLEITNGEIKTNIVNNLTFEGIKYNADFSANYTNRSLVDKGYVTGGFVPYTGATTRLEMGTNDILFDSGYGIDTQTTVGTDTLNIGATNAEVINYGNASTIHNFLGTAIYELQVNSYVTDKLITLNYGGSLSSGIGVGFEIEENSVITGYIKTNASRNAYSLKTPAINFYSDLSLASLTANRTHTLPDQDGTFTVLGNATTGSGSTLVLSTSPTFTTDITTPSIIGGTLVGSGITYKGTTGVGTSTVSAHTFTVGNNGATTAAQIFNSGQVSIGNYASPTNLRALTIGQDTAYVSIGSVVSAPSSGGIYFTTASPSITNYSLRGDGSSLLLNAPNGSVQVQVGGSTVYTFANQSSTLSPAQSASGAVTPFTFTVASNTGQSSGVEISNFKVNGASKTWANGGAATTIPTQRWNHFTANTAATSGGGSLAITKSYGLYVEQATAGSNVTITYNNALGTSGNFESDGRISIISGSAQPNGLDGMHLYFASSVAHIQAINSGVSARELRLSGFPVSIYSSNSGAIVANFAQQQITFSPQAYTTGALGNFVFSVPNNTGQAASTEIPNFKVNGASKTWANGGAATTIALQRWNYFTANTANTSGGGSLTITDSVTNYAEVAVAGTASITNNWGFGTNGGIKIFGTANTVLGNAALATNATKGFLHVPSCAGTPTGTPTLYTGMIPICADSTNNKLYIYSGGAWVALN